MMPLTMISREEFLDNIYRQSRSYDSQRIARLTLKYWDEYCRSKDPNFTPADVMNYLKQIQSQPEFYLFMDGFVQYLNRKEFAFRTIKINFTYLKSWLRANGIRIYNEDVKQFIKFPKQIKEMRKPLTHEMISIILANSSKRLAAIFLTLISSGMRLGEVLQLRVMDFEIPKDDSMPIIVHIRADTTKTKEERISFISREAWNATLPYYTGKKGTEYVYVKEYKHHTKVQLERRFGMVRKRCGFETKYGNGFNYHVNMHAFRAFFHTQATRVLGGDIAHALIGHHKYLDQYFRLTPEERADQYKKLEPYLTISNETRLETELEKKDAELAKVNDMEQQIKELQAKLKRMNI